MDEYNSGSTRPYGPIPNEHAGVKTEHFGSTQEHRTNDLDRENYIDQKRFNRHYNIIMNEFDTAMYVSSILFMRVLSMITNYSTNVHNDELNMTDQQFYDINAILAPTEKYLKMLQKDKPKMFAERDKLELEPLDRPPIIVSVERMGGNKKRHKRRNTQKRKRNTRRKK